MQDDRDINCELYVNKGRGYVESEMHPTDRSFPVDLVRIDAIYNPVRRANFTVAETRVGQRTDYDRLDALGRDQRHHLPGRRARLRRGPRPGALPLLRRVRQGAGARRAGRETAGAGQPSGADRPGRLAGPPIDDLGLSVRSLNSLKNSSIRTLKDLVEFSARRILDEVKNIGEKALQEIAELLQSEGLNFGMKFDEVDGDLRITDHGTLPALPAASGEEA